MAEETTETRDALIEVTLYGAKTHEERQTWFTKFWQEVDELLVEDGHTMISDTTAVGEWQETNREVGVSIYTTAPLPPYVDMCHVFEENQVRISRDLFERMKAIVQCAGYIASSTEGWHALDTADVSMDLALPICREQGWPHGDDPDEENNTHE